MNKPIICCVATALALCSVGAVLGQDQPTTTQRATTKSTPTTQNASVEDLMRAYAVDSEEEILLEIGRRGDVAAMPFLKKLIDPKSSSPSTIRAARRAAARLGDEEQWNAIVADVRSDDALVARNAIYDLGYVGGSRSIQLLGPLLYKDRPTPHGDDTAMEAPARAAISALSQIIPDGPPARRPNLKRINKEELRAWQAWWEKHRAGYE